MACFIAGVLVSIGALVPEHAVGAGLPRATLRDREAIVTLERTWLHAQDAATLDRILAPEFIHPVPGGIFLTKAQHIAWVTAHPRPASTQIAFEKLNVRLYGTLAVANGVVVTRAPRQSAQRSIFTDVFVYRDGRWQAINAQENIVVDH